MVFCAVYTALCAAATPSKSLGVWNTREKEDVRTGLVLVNSWDSWIYSLHHSARLKLRSSFLADGKLLFKK
jgi:hypothetical protein